MNSMPTKIGCFSLGRRPCFNCGHSFHCACLALRAQSSVAALFDNRKKQLPTVWKIEIYHMNWANISKIIHTAPQHIPLAGIFHASNLRESLYCIAYTHPSHMSRKMSVNAVAPIGSREHIWRVSHCHPINQSLSQMSGMMSTNIDRSILGDQDYRNRFSRQSNTACDVLNACADQRCLGPCWQCQKGWRSKEFGMRKRNSTVMLP